MRRCFLLVATLTALCALAPAASLLSENFDELTPMLTATSAGAFATIGGTNVDIVGGALFGSLCAAPESGNCIDLDGTNGNSQGDLQTTSAIMLTPGVNYFLSFDLIGSGRGVTTSTSVTFGPYSQTFSLTSSDTTSGIVSNQLVTVSTPTAADLNFTSNTPGNVGALLDNVTITSGTTATPEPSSGVLLLSAAIATTALLRFCRRAASR